MKNFLKKICTLFFCFIITLNFCSCNTIDAISYLALNRKANYTDINVECELTLLSLVSVSHEITITAYNKVDKLILKIEYYDGNSFKGSTTVNIGTIGKGETRTKEVYPDLAYKDFIKINNTKTYIEEGYTSRF